MFKKENLFFGNGRVLTKYRSRLEWKKPLVSEFSSSAYAFVTHSNLYFNPHYKITFEPVHNHIKKYILIFTFRTFLIFKLSKVSFALNCAHRNQKSLVFIKKWLLIHRRRKYLNI